MALPTPHSPPRIHLATSIWIVEDGLVSASEAKVLSSRLPRTPLGRAGEDLLRGLSREEPLNGPAHPHWPGAMQALAQCLNTSPQALPWAAWSAQADGLQPQAGEHWGFLSTGRLHMTPQQVRLLLQESPTDSRWREALAGGIAEELPLQLHQGASGQLYLSSAEVIEIEAMHPSLLQEVHLPDALPTGAHARAWRKASQLACMLTHTWSSESGYPDALWLWGVSEVRQSTRPAEHGLPPSSSSVLWTEGFRAAWAALHQRPAPRLEWQPLPTEPESGQDMVACWASHWQRCLLGLSEDASRSGHPLLISSLKTQSRLWSPSPTPSPAWQLGLGQAPDLRSLPALLAMPETE
jgi:hypothetical protein